MATLNTSTKQASSSKHFVYRKKYNEIWPLVVRLFRDEKRDVLVVLVYGIIASILGLVVPLSSQAIVNAVALGVHTEQLVVLCVIVLLSMLAMAVILIFQRHVIDYIQRRQFVVTAREIVERLPKVQERVYEDIYAPELVNRFFDVVTVQKALSKFLLDGMAALLSLLTGFIVLGIYHPLFLIYDIVFLLFIPILVFVLGRNALSTSIEESSIKYKTVEWIEEVARSHRSIKQGRAYQYATDKVDDISFAYAEAKERHFRILARQIIGSYVFKAFATVGILALGGDLVIEQQISLGQLIAAEIIIILMLNSLDKLLSVFDTYYEFAAGLTKIQILKELPLEVDGRAKITSTSGAKAIELVDISLPSHRAHHHDETISFAVVARTNTALVCHNAHESTYIGKLMGGLHFPSTGHVEAFGVHTNTIVASDIHKNLYYLDREDVVHQGTIYDNIVFGGDIEATHLQTILQAVCLDEDVRRLPDGIHTSTDTLGRNLTHSMRVRIVLARALAASPSLLIVNGLIELLDRHMRRSVINGVHGYSNITKIWITTDVEVISHCDNVIVINDGTLEYQGPYANAIALSPTLTALSAHQ